MGFDLLPSHDHSIGFFFVFCFVFFAVKWVVRIGCGFQNWMTQCPWLCRICVISYSIDSFQQLLLFFYLNYEALYAQALSG